MKILLTGPQGSGKTTQSKILSQALDLCLVKAGDLVRQKAEEASEVGKRITEALAKGDLIDDQVMADLIKEHLSHPMCANGFIVDGYPRTFSQLQMFDPDYDLIIHITLSDEEGRKRALARGRADDTPELIEKRLAWYHQLTKEVVDFYRRQGKRIIEIDGAQSEEQVAQDIQGALNG